MQKETLTPQVSQRICAHMNRDHKDSVFKYASHFGGISNPKTVEMIEITTIAMNLKVDGKMIEIPFDHKLQDSSDAHQTLVSMIKDCI